MDETVYGRELGPLAAFYPSMYVGVPWWFIDAPDSIKRFRRAVTEYGTFYKTSGFIDDTRAFLSIPARHDMSRRLDCVHLADLVAEHRLEMDEALRRRPLPGLRYPAPRVQRPRLTLYLIALHPRGWRTSHGYPPPGRTPPPVRRRRWTAVQGRGGARPRGRPRPAHTRCNKLPSGLGSLGWAEQRTDRDPTRRSMTCSQGRRR